MIAVGGYRVGNITTRAYDDAGTLLWSRDHGATVWAVAADRDSNVYTGGALTGGVTTRKYDAAGNLLWSASHGATVNAITVDGAGNVYTGGSRNGAITTRKYDAAGNLLWSRDHGAAVDGIAVDDAGNVYTVGTGVSSVMLRKYDSAGNQTLTIDFLVRGRAVRLAANGDIYIAGDRSMVPHTHRRYSAAGAMLWSADARNTMYAAVLDSAGDFFVGGEPYNGLSIWKYSAANVYKTALAGSAVNGLAADLSGNLLAVGASGSLIKFNGSGVQQWTKAHGDILNAVAWAPSPAVTAVPPFSLGFGLAALVGYSSHIVAPFLFGFGLAAPVSSEETPPDLAGRPVSRIYRAYLTGQGSGLFEVPLRALECVRRLGASTWLSVFCPTYVAALESAIAARLGGELLVYTGERLRDGTERMGLFLRATLADFEHERDPRRGGFRLIARVITPSYTARTRTLTGVTNLIDDAGRIEVVCSVDPLLRPNDIAIAGTISFLVGSIRYRIEPETALMTVLERADG